MIKKIVILGPESSGKSTLAAELTNFFNGCLVREYARDYLSKINRKYKEEDLVKIARGQLDLEDYVEKDCIKSRKELILYDTDITVIKVWSEYKFGRCHPWIVQQYNERVYDLYLLTYPDLEWKQDPLRESPDKLEEIFEIYLDEMKNRNLNYCIVSGSGNTRTERAKRMVKEQFF